VRRDRAGRATRLTAAAAVGAAALAPTQRIGRRRPLAGRPTSSRGGAHRRAPVRRATAPFAPPRLLRHRAFCATAPFAPVRRCAGAPVRPTRGRARGPARRSVPCPALRVRVARGGARPKFV